MVMEKLSDPVEPTCSCDVFWPLVTLSLPPESSSTPPSPLLTPQPRWPPSGTGSSILHSPALRACWRLFFLECLSMKLTPPCLGLCSGWGGPSALFWVQGMERSSRGRRGVPCAAALKSAFLRKTGKGLRAQAVEASLRGSKALNRSWSR